MLWLCNFGGLRKLLGLTFRQKDQLKKIITFYLKVLGEEWQNSQKLPKSLKTIRLKNFLKKREFQNNF